MRAALRIDACIGEPKPLDRPAADQVFRDNLFRVGRLHAAVPDSLRVHDDGRSMLALVQASGLVDAHRRAQAGGLGKLLKLRKQLALSIAGTGWPGSARGTLIMTDEDMAFKRCQNGKSSNCNDIGPVSGHFSQAGMGSRNQAVSI